MYLGKVVETAAYNTVYADPNHPYTQALLSAVPIPNPRSTTQRQILEGDVPSPANPPQGCNFNTRCPLVFDRCFVEETELRETAPGHWCACHLVE